MPGRRFRTDEERAFERAWGALELPNARAGYQTPSTLAIDLRYAKLHVFGRWDWHRYSRLAKYLNLTVYELASVVCLNHSAVARYQSNNMLTSDQRSVALLLTMLECHVCASIMDDVIPDVLPDLNQVAANHESPAHT